jgi:serine-type D-Ala-D-Ala carboxypeptidase (penicillin-binding protein 5/6)
MGRSGWLSVIITVLILLAAVPSPQTARAQVLAPYWIIYDATNEVVLDQERMDERVPLASLTKMMTGLLAAENLSLSQEVTIVKEDLVGEAAIWVQEDDVVTVRTLLYGLMMRSGNDAASALARTVGGSPNRESPLARQRFVSMMNERAAELGMEDTRFTNPHGLDEDNHYSSARDLAILTVEVLDNRVLAQPFGADSYAAEGLAFVHTNQLPKLYDGVLGGKTGWTNKAGLCLIEVVERDGRTLIIVLLGSTFERWYADAIELLDYGWMLPEPGTTTARAENVFLWWKDRTDGPVERGEVARSWLWGPEPISSARSEPYADSPGGKRLVQYFDKGRMEITDPFADISSGWYVTGGHLARELITGELQRGDAEFVFRSSARVPVAGDPDASGPTYRDFAQLMEPPEGQLSGEIVRALGADGILRTNLHLARYDVLVIDANSPTGHGIASVFLEYLEQTGPIVERGETVDARLFDPTFALVGLPITEPVWTRVPVGGRVQDVLAQCFERRCLTYTPKNDPDWQVEMGNIGQHYLEWSRSNRILSRFDIPTGFDRHAADTFSKPSASIPPPFVTGL